MSQIQYHLRDLDVIERRVVSRDELCQLHATTVRMKSRCWALGATAVTAIALLSELAAHGWIPPELAAFIGVTIGLVAGFKLVQLLRPLWRLRRLSSGSEILECEPADPYRSLDRHVRVVAPLGVVLQRDRSDLTSPEALRIRSVVAIPAAALANIERQIAEGAIDGSRVLEGAELREARRRLGDKRDSVPFAILVGGMHSIILVVDHQAYREAIAVFPLYILASLGMRKITKPTPIEAKFSVRTSVDGTPVRWAEFIGEKVWNIEGEPADWRKR